MVPCGTHACGILAKKRKKGREREREREEAKKAREASIGWKRPR